MKKISVKILAALLVMAMMLAMFPVVALGAESTAVSGELGDNGKNVLGNKTGTTVEEEPQFVADSKGQKVAEDEENSIRFKLITSEEELTDGEYMVMVVPTGLYAGEFEYYFMTTTEDSEYTAFQAAGAEFDAFPGGLILEASGSEKYIWTIDGDSTGLVLKSNDGSVEGGITTSGAYLKYGKASTWVATYKASQYGFVLSNGSEVLVLRDDIDVTGTNGNPLFAVESATATTGFVHLYKKTCSHGNTSITVEEATCTEAGQSVEICDDCGEVVSTTTIDPEGHTTETATIPATCTEDGQTVESCTICGEVVETVVIPATGHDYFYSSNDDGSHSIGCFACDYADVGECLLEDNTCVECGYVAVVIPTVEFTPGTYVIAAKVGNTYYAMSDTFASKIAGTPIPVMGGKVSTVNAEGYAVVLEETEGGWTIKGANGYLKYGSGTNLGKNADPYTWILTTGTNGTYRLMAQTDGRGVVFRAGTYNQFGGYALSNVSLGDTEYFDVELRPVEEFQVSETFDVKINHTLNIASDISIVYAVTTEQLAGFERFYLECVIPTYEGNTQTGSRTIILEPVLNGNYYYFTMDGMTAVQMNDVVESTLYAFKENTVYISEVDLYSVATYAYNQLNKAGITEGLKTLCAELLRYGAKAQIFKGYRTANLADDSMTATHKALLSDLNSVVFNQNNTVLEDLLDPTVTWAGKGLSLDSKVTLRMIADLSNYDGAPEDLTVRVTYTNLEGKQTTEILDNIAVYSAANNYYAFSFSGLRASELRTVVSAAVYAGETQVSPTLQYSMDTYGNGRTGDLLVLCQALFSYSDAALSYFKN